MEKGEDSCVKYTVDLSPRCEKAYKKLAKRCDPKLLDIINTNIDQLETNPELGEELSQDLKGMRSIHINQYHYRIVYEVETGNPTNKVTVHAIAHRKEVYAELSQYLGRDFRSNLG